MDQILEQQINELIEKTTNDLKLKICKLVVKSQTKLIKDHEKELKSNGVNQRERGEKVERTERGTDRTTDRTTEKRTDKNQKSKVTNKKVMKNSDTDSDCYSD
jgi:hypothetical protein